MEVNTDISIAVKNERDDNMLATQKKSMSGLTQAKKEILRKAKGAASSKTINLNKIRDEWKNGTN